MNYNFNLDPGKDVLCVQTELVLTVFDENNVIVFLNILRDRFENNINVFL